MVLEIQNVFAVLKYVVPRKPASSLWLTHKFNFQILPVSVLAYLFFGLDLNDRFLLIKAGIFLFVAASVVKSLKVEPGTYSRIAFIEVMR